MSNHSEEDHHHREAVGKVEVVMVMDEDVGHLAEVLDMLKPNSRRWFMLYDVVRRVTLLML